jgi:lipopolysaccharide heptosyltransferase I
LKVLLVRLGALGDIVHAIPVAAALRRAHRGARIDWLVSARHRDLLDLVPVIDRRLVISDRGTESGSSVPVRESPSLFQAVKELRQSRYDVAVDLQGLIKSALIARSAGAGRVIGFASRYLREPLARMFYTDVYDPGGAGMYASSETRHVVEINLGLLEPLGIRAGAPEFPIEEAASPVGRELCERTEGRYVLLNPGAAWSNKRWPPDRFAAVAAAVLERHGLKSVVLWGPGEQELADAVVAHARGAAIRSPETAIADVVALARGAAMMLSGDTGPTHIAAAVGTPIVGLYGPTRPERNGPWRPSDATVSRADVCQCHHLRRCKRAEMCLLDISVGEVLTAIDRVLGAGRARAAFDRSRDN